MDPPQCGLSPLASRTTGRPATSDLVTALNSDNRYVSGKAAQTLKRIKTPEAQDLLMDHLFTARWCPETSAASRH